MLAKNTFTVAQKFKRAVDEYCKENQEDGRREHLGASVIGRKCHRELWYSYRWADIIVHEGRMVRLFERGHLEEYRFCAILEGMGCRVVTYDPAFALLYHSGSDSYVVAPRASITDDTYAECDDVSESKDHRHAAQLRDIKLPQLRFSACGGHFGGSLDALVYNFPMLEELGLPPDAVLCGEFKTSGQSSFLRVMKHVTIQGEKNEHIDQQNLYMRAYDAAASLYLMVNKNTDEWHVEIFNRDDPRCQQLERIANNIIFAPKPPPKISESPAWFDCKFCDFHAKCHLGKPYAESCRTCKFSQPTSSGDCQWFCNNWNMPIPNKQAQIEGCPSYASIPEG
jgi:hypothetical protein